jgi:MFS transporter, FHS family, L-fucose permease
MTQTVTTTKPSYAYQLSIIGLLFFIFGFVTWLNGILIPFFKTACQLTDLQAYLVATAFFAAYFVMALPSSWILGRTGTKNGMALGLWIMAAGCLLFLPAAGARSFPLFLTGLFIQGTGLALLQTASNPYVSVIGPIDAAAQRISIMGISNKLAGIIGNFILGAILLKGADELSVQIANAADETVKNDLLNALVKRVETPYAAIALVLVIFAFVIRRSSLPDISTQVADPKDDDNRHSQGKTSITQFPQVWLGAMAIFTYVGAEVMAGDLITVYGKNLGFSTDQSKFFTIFGLIGLLLGYLASIILIPKYVKQETWLMVSALLGITLTLGSYVTDGTTAVGCLAALGFANAVMWPAIFPLGIRNLGRFTNFGSAMLIMGIVGGAIIPPFYGWLYEKSGIGFDFRSAFVVIMVVCYTYILWFGRSQRK